MSVDDVANLRDVDDEVAAAMSDPAEPGPGLDDSRGSTADPLAGPMADREHFERVARRRLRERRALGPIPWVLGIIATTAVRARGQLIDGNGFTVMVLTELLTYLRTLWMMAYGFLRAHCGLWVGLPRRMVREAACDRCSRLERDSRAVEYCGGDKDPGSSCGGHCPRAWWWPFSALRYRWWLRFWSCPIGVWPEQLRRIGLEDPGAEPVDEARLPGNDQDAVTLVAEGERAIAEGRVVDHETVVERFTEAAGTKV